MKFERSPFGTDRVRAIDSQIDNHLVNLGSVGGHGGQMIRKVTPKLDASSTGRCNTICYKSFF